MLTRNPVRFHLRAKKAQVKALRRFARSMKWPNLATVDEVLKEKAPDAKALEDRSELNLGANFPFLWMHHEL